MPDQSIMSLQTIPFKGGIDEVHSKTNLDPVGSLGNISYGIPQAQNVRPLRDEFEQRKGMAKHSSTTAHSTKNVSTLYCHSKGEQDEIALFAQMGDGSVEKATDNPPATTTGNFGSSVLPARSGASPGSFANFKDYMVYADGAGQAQIYTGSNQKCSLFNVYKGTVMPDIPTEGADFTPEVTDGQTTTFAELDSLSTLANFDALFIGFETPVNKITFTISEANGNASVATLAYRKDDSSWADSSDTDGTISGGASMGQTGSFTWTLPTDEVPHYAFGKSLFIYRIVFSVALDAQVEVTAVTGENTAGFQDIQNLWDGKLVEGVAAFVEDSSASTFYQYSSQAIKAGTVVGAASHDYIYFGSQDPIIGFYLNVEKTPNTTATTTIDELATWTGAAFTALSSLEDGTNGGAQNGFVTAARNSSIRQRTFRHWDDLYWYRVRFDKTLSGSARSGLVWKIHTLPYFDINKTHFPIAQAVTRWEDQLVYSFANSPFVFLTDKEAPMVLNGDNAKKIRCGDGRNNLVIAIRHWFGAFCLAWQQEKGGEGGTTTLIERGNNDALSKLVLDDKVGILNAKCVTVVSSVNYADITPENPIQKTAYWLSSYGFHKTNGDGVKNISGGIANRFDPEKSNSIRRGFEKEHFLGYDSAKQVNLIGLVVNAENAVNAGPAVDRGGGVVGIPVTGHTARVNTRITFDGTTNYDNEYIVRSDSTVDEIRITETYNAETLGGTETLNATGPNKWFVHDPLTDWITEDLWGYGISCMAEVEAASGNLPILQYAGCEDGFVRHINTGNQDDGIDINSDIVIDIDGHGHKVILEEDVLICEAQASGDITRTIAINGNTSYGLSETLSMIAQTSGDTYRRNRIPSGDIKGHHLSIKWENLTSNVPAKYSRFGLKVRLQDSRD